MQPCLAPSPAQQHCRCVPAERRRHAAAHISRCRCRTSAPLAPSCAAAFGRKSVRHTQPLQCAAPALTASHWRRWCGTACRAVADPPPPPGGAGDDDGGSFDIDALARQLGQAAEDMRSAVGSRSVACHSQNATLSWDVSVVQAYLYAAASDTAAGLTALVVKAAHVYVQSDVESDGDEAGGASSASEDEEVARRWQEGSAAGDLEIPVPDFGLGVCPTPQARHRPSAEVSAVSQVMPHASAASWWPHMCCHDDCPAVGGSGGGGDGGGGPRRPARFRLPAVAAPRAPVCAAGEMCSAACCWDLTSSVDVLHELMVYVARQLAESCCGSAAQCCHELAPATATA
jgi:hypothetical protein